MAGNLSSPIEMSHVTDFYFLDAMTAHASMESAKRGSLGGMAEDKWREDVIQERDNIAGQLALAFRNYLFVAGVGEMRHAESRCSRWLEEVPSSLSRNAACERALEFDPASNLQLMVDLFKQSWNGGGYGGLKWANCMDAALQYGIWPDVMFVDHAVDLEHNGGSVFDKTSAAKMVGLGLSFKWPGMEMKRFLDIKRDEDLLTFNPTSLFSHPYAITATTFSLWCRWWNIYNSGCPPWLKRVSEQEFLQWPTYGNKAPHFGELMFTERTKHNVQEIQAPQAEYSTPRAYAEYGERDAEYERGESIPTSPNSSDDTVDKPGVPRREYAYIPS